MFKSISIILYKSQQAINDNDMLQFHTIGNYDFIGVKSLDNQKLPLYHKNNDFDGDNLYSSHKFYAALHNREDNAESFLNNNDSPYMFVSMIHFNYSTDELTMNQYNYCLNEIEKRLKGSNYIIYDALDCCDIILFLKAELCSQGTQIIQDIDSITEVKYSYSVLSFNIDRINTDNFENEIIDKITVCGIVDDLSCFPKWRKSLESECHQSDDCNIYQYGRMGNEDIIVNIINGSTRLLFNMICKENGALNYSNINYKKTFSFVRIHIDQHKDDQYEPYEKLEKAIELDRLKLEERFILACNTAYEHNNIIIDESIKQAALQVFNSCDYLSQKNFALDIRDCIKNPVSLFLQKIVEYEPIANKSGHDLVEYNESIKKFTTGIMSIVNGSLQADRMFFQVPGFNAVLYDVPSKLIVFYSAFVQNVADLLKDNELNNPFAFLVCPDLYQYTHISKLFNEEERDDGLLLKVRIPVNSLFNTKRLMCELTHEVAHFVGKKSRNRKYRATLEVNMLSAEIIKYVFRKIDLSEYSKKSTSIVLKKMQNTLVENLNKEIDEVRRTFAENDPSVDSFYSYQSYYKKILLNATFNYFKKPNSTDKLLEIVFSDLDLIDLSFEHYNKIKYQLDSNMSRVQLHCISIIDGLHELMKESYADLIMILTLGLDVREYVMSFYKPLYNFYGNPVDILSKNNIGERIASILLAYENKVSQLNLTSYFSEIQSPDEKQKIREFENELKKYTGESDERLINNHNCLSSPAIEYNSKYLARCKRDYENQYVNSRKQMCIRELFSQFKNNDVFLNISSIRKYTADFRNSFYLKDKQLIN